MLAPFAPSVLGAAVAGFPLAIGPNGGINPLLATLRAPTPQVPSGENLSRAQAVQAYPRGGAYAEFADANKGALLPGRLADLAGLSHDVFSVPAAQRSSLRSV